MRTRRTFRHRGTGPVINAVVGLAGVAVLIAGCTGPTGALSEPSEPATEQPTLRTGDDDAHGDHDLPGDDDVPGHDHDHEHQPTGSGDPMHDTAGQNPGVGEPPIWTEVDEQAVLARGREAMEAFARPGMAPVVWVEEMLVFTAPQARDNFAYIDPVNITATQVQGVELADGATGSMAQVIARTDGPGYVVTMTRLGDGQPWLVERINLK